MKTKQNKYKVSGFSVNASFGIFMTLYVSKEIAASLLSVFILTDKLPPLRVATNKHHE